jgi:hypothetical protein
LGALGCTIALLSVPVVIDLAWDPVWSRLREEPFDVAAADRVVRALRSDTLREDAMGKLSLRDRPVAGVPDVVHVTRAGSEGLRVFFPTYMWTSRRGYVYIEDDAAVLAAGRRGRALDPVWLRLGAPFLERVPLTRRARQHWYYSVQHDNLRRER